jgi:hypothetical protein
VRDRGFAAIEHAREIRPDDAMPFIVGHLRDWDADANPGAVHEHIQPAESSPDRFDRALNRRWIAHVAHDADHLRAACRQCVFGFDDAMGRGSGDADAVAGLNQRLRNGETNSPRSAGD